MSAAPSAQTSELLLAQIASISAQLAAAVACKPVDRQYVARLQNVVAQLHEELIDARSEY
jgi:hypothetical protein